MRSIKLLIM